MGRSTCCGGAGTREPATRPQLVARAYALASAASSTVVAVARAYALAMATHARLLAETDVQQGVQGHLAGKQKKNTSLWSGLQDCTY
jgi:hypothetical protein